jgi:hypothetical protein
VLTYGNNVLTEASRSESVAFPWEARQLLLHASATAASAVLADAFAAEYVG